MDLVKNFKNLPTKTKNLMSLGIILALLIALPLFIWAITNLNFNQKERAASSEPIDITLGEPVRGLPSAVVTIVAYTDFQCPFCKMFVDNTFSTILATYPNDVKFVFKDFPILSQHPLAENAAIAGQCAFSQGMFWEMHDLIFAKQDTLSTVDLGSDFPNQLGLDMTVYNNCYSTRQTLPEVQDDMTEGSFKGVAGTPTFFVGLSSNFTGATKIDGAQPFSNFQTIIDGLLANQPTATATSTSASTAAPTATATATSTSGTGGYVEGEPNSCGGTCGSNYNCKANLYCYQGFCRNPICSSETDCDCSVSATATATAKSSNSAVVSKTSTAKSTAKGSAKPTPTYTSGMTLIDKDEDLDLVRSEDTITTEGTENMFLVKYAMYIVGALALFVIIVLISVFKKKKDNNIPHITPPTNI